MSQLTMRQIAGYAAAAGFRGEGLARAVAVAWAESSGRTDARNVNADSQHSVDRGLWQINSYWHREVSDAAADDPARAAAAAFRISAHGSSWGQWATWPSPASSHLAAARRAAGNPVDAPGGAVRATQVGAGGGPGGNPITNMPGWLWFLAGKEVESGAAQGATDAAMELVRAAAPAVLTVALAGGAMALIAVGLSQSAKPSKPSKPGGESASD